MGLWGAAGDASASRACGWGVSKAYSTLAAAETAPGRVLEGVYSLGVILEVKRKALEQANKF